MTAFWIFINTIFFFIFILIDSPYLDYWLTYFILISMKHTETERLQQHAFLFRS